MTTLIIITNYNFQESPNLKVKPGKGEGGLGLTFEVKKSLNIGPHYEDCLQRFLRTPDQGCDVR